MLGLSWVDIAILGVMALSMLTGFIRGFVKELVALLVWVSAFWIAFHYAGNIVARLPAVIHGQAARWLAAIVLVIITMLILGAILNLMLRFLLTRSGLSGTDRLLGMTFGTVRGIFIVSFLMFLVKMTSMPFEEYTKDARLVPYFHPVVDWLGTRLPPMMSQMKLFEKVQPWAVQKPEEAQPNTAKEAVHKQLKTEKTDGH